MTAKELEESLTAIARTAQHLRREGVSRVMIGEVTIELAQPEAPPPQVAQQPTEPANPLDDPETFGGYIPQRRGKQAPQEHEE